MSSTFALSPEVAEKMRGMARASMEADRQFKALLTLQRASSIYAGTVPAAVVARRRAANKVARRSRRVNRGRS